MNANFGDLIKAQLLLSQKDNIIFTMVILVVFEFVMNFTKQVYEMIFKRINNYFDTKLANINKTLELTTSQVEAEISFERIYGKLDNWDKVDAVLNYALKIPDAQSLLIIGQIEIVKNKNKFQIAPNIYLIIDTITSDNNGVLKQINIRLTSPIMSVCELRDWVNSITEVFLADKKNGLNDKRYFFDQIVEPRPKNSRVPTNNRLVFSKNLFVSNRNLTNVFHERQDEITTRVKFFLNNKDWYDQRGIPYTLGLLLHGEPGTGKTSTIKAIAKEADRHIININLGAIKSRKNLKKLFNDEKIQVVENVDNATITTDYIIPINKRLYVCEDFDCTDESSFLLKREFQNTKTVTPIFQHQESNPVVDADAGESDIDLSTLLNIIDGTLESPGRIIIFTSNFPERLDSALIRPGRIDLMLEYKKCNSTVIHNMYQSFYEKQLDPTIKFPDYTWSPAQVSQVLFKHVNDPDLAVKELLNTSPLVLEKSEPEPDFTLLNPLPTVHESTQTSEPFAETFKKNLQEMAESSASIDTPTPRELPASEWTEIPNDEKEETQVENNPQDSNLMHSIFQNKVNMPQYGSSLDDQYNNISQDTTVTDIYEQNLLFN